jgi:hypothetical protein
MRIAPWFCGSVGGSSYDNNSGMTVNRCSEKTVVTAREQSAKIRGKTRKKVDKWLNVTENKLQRKS